jgi:hypothetical protein
MKLRSITLGVALGLIAMGGTLVPSQMAAASTKGRKTTTEVLGGLAAEQLLTGKTRNGLLLGAGAAYAYKRYQDSKKADRRKAAYHSSYARSRYGGASTVRTVRTTGRLTVTGRVTDTAGATDRNITVTANGVARRIQVPASAYVIYGGSELSVHRIHYGDVVRVAATRVGNGRWKAERVRVLSRR